MKSSTLITLIILFFASACTKSAEKSNNIIDIKINSCIDQKLNEGWDTQRAESFCDNHY